MSGACILAFSASLVRLLICPCSCIRNESSGNISIRAVGAFRNKPASSSVAVQEHYMRIATPPLIAGKHGLMARRREGYTASTRWRQIILHPYRRFASHRTSCFFTSRVASTRGTSATACLPSPYCSSALQWKRPSQHRSYMALPDERLAAGWCILARWSGRM